MTNICSRTMFSEHFRKDIEDAAKEMEQTTEISKHNIHVFWKTLTKNTSLTVFDKLDGVYGGYRSLVVPNKTVVFLLPCSKEGEKYSPYYEFHPCLMKDELCKKCVIEKVGWEEMIHICENKRFPDRLKNIILNLQEKN